MQEEPLERYTHSRLAEIEDARRLAGVSVKLLAEEAGINRSTLTTALNGITPQQLRDLERACRRNGVKL